MFYLLRRLWFSTQTQCGEVEVWLYIWCFLFPSTHFAHRLCDYTPTWGRDVFTPYHWRGFDGFWFRWRRLVGVDIGWKYTRSSSLSYTKLINSQNINKSQSIKHWLVIIISSLQPDYKCIYYKFMTYSNMDTLVFSFHFYKLWHDDLSFIIFQYPSCYKEVLLFNSTKILHFMILKIGKET